MSDRTERDIMLAWCEMMLLQAKHLDKSAEIIHCLETLCDAVDMGNLTLTIMTAWQSGYLLGPIAEIENLKSKLSRGDERELERIKELRAEGLSYQKVAWRMDEDFPKPNGKKWTTGQVKSRLQYDRKKKGKT